MAKLGASDLSLSYQRWIHSMMQDKEIIGNLTRAQVQAAVDAADTWANDNASAYNAALPLPARTTLSSKQKAAILVHILNRRYELGL
jgi:hypothetical protein